MAYDQLDPVGELRGDIRTARQLSLMINMFIARYGKKPHKWTKPIDFMPDYEKANEEEEMQEPQQTQTLEEMKGQIHSIGSMFGLSKSKKEKKKKGEK